MLKHADIWRAIDRLAERHGMSASGLAKRAGLSATLFNPSKRSRGKRQRWPSTESIALILRATGATLDDFVALAARDAPPRLRLPLTDLVSAGKPGVFDDQGLPVEKVWDEMGFPCAEDPQAFALEITGKQGEPDYREGTRVLIAPSEKPRRGDRVVVRVPTKDGHGDILIKRLGREGGQKVEFLPLHPDDAPLTLPRREIEWMYRITWAGQ